MFNCSLGFMLRIRTFPLLRGNHLLHIGLPYCMISSLDDVPVDMYSSLASLDLAHNNLCDLVGTCNAIACKFPNVRYLIMEV